MPAVSENRKLTRGSRVPFLSGGLGRVFVIVGAFFGLFLAGSWLSTDGRLPPGLTGIFTRLPRRAPREAATPSEGLADPATV